MKRVDNSDVNIKLDSRIVYLSNFNAKFYTVNAENFFIRKTQDNVISAETEDNNTEYYIKLDWNELVTLGEGVLQYKIVNNIPDSDRADLYFNKNLERTTEYYINSNVTVDPESEESYAEIIAELGVKIDTEIARSTSADTVHDEAIQDEVITRQQNVSDLTDLITALRQDLTDESEVRNSADTSIWYAIDAEIVRATIAESSITNSLNNEVLRATSAETQISSNLSNEINRATTAENALSGAINTNKSDIATLANQISNEVTNRENADNQLSSKIDTKLDATAYTPTDLTDYYKKSEVYNKTEIDNKGYITEHQDISGKLNISDFNAYSAHTKTIIDSKVDSTDLDDYASKEFVSGFTYNKTATDELLSAKLDTTAYTPTDLTNYYTKSETSGATEIQTALGNKQDILISGTNIKTINNQSLLGNGNVEIQGGFIQVTNPDTAETKVGLVSSLSQYYDTNIGKGAVIEGDGYEYDGTNYNIVASGNYAHAEGWYTKAIGNSSHAEGQITIASGSSSHAEGNSTTANGNVSHAEGYYTVAIGSSSHAECQNTIASGDYSHAEGGWTTASTIASHAEGYSTLANGNYSHAEGNSTRASGSSSHAEGNYTKALGGYSHAEGDSTQAIGLQSHAEGGTTIASNWAAHAEGQSTLAGGQRSHAEGMSTVAFGDDSHAEGYGTIANNTAEHASGRYNVSSSASTTFGDSGNTLFSVGNGTYENKHNAFEIRQNGDIYITSGSTDIKLQDHLDDGGGSNTPIVILSQSEYDALTTKDDNTVYIITDADGLQLGYVDAGEY